MVTDYAGRRVLPLSDKETAQLVSYSERCQPYYAFDEVVFCKLIDLVLPEIRCNLYIGNNAVYRYLKEKLNLFVGKYYPNGFKENTQSDYLFFRNELVKYSALEYIAVSKITIGLRKICSSCLCVLAEIIYMPISQKRQRINL